MRENHMEQTTLNHASNKPTVSIHYCRQCNWMLRASWLSQELLHTFSEELGAVTLCPDTGGRFEIFCNGVQIWDRKAEGGFPEAKILKQRVRNIIAPERDLGHVDSK
jgi:selenoprotein W-related protein